MKLRDPWRSLLPAKTLLACAGKGLTIPDRWTAAVFARRGQLLARTIHRTARLVQAKAGTEIARRAAKIFREQMDRIIDIATGHTMGLRSIDPFTININAGAIERLWAMAIQEVLGTEARVDVIADLVPPIRSVMDQGYSKTTTLMAIEPNPTTAATFDRESWNIATRIVNINDTTRKRIEGIVRQVVDDGGGVVDVANQIREAEPSIAQARAMTIARTETNNAWTRGAAQTFKQVPTLTHVSVVGCMAREANSPQWNGESTCNYEDIPIGQLDEFLAVGFHPNHTGSIVPSRFSDD